MSKYKIEKDVPFTGGVPNLTKYPFAEMDVGDSFVVTGPEKHIVRAAAYAFARHSGNKVKFATRSEGENTTRIWRIK